MFHTHIEPQAKPLPYVTISIADKYFEGELSGRLSSETSTVGPFVNATYRPNLEQLSQCINGASFSHDAPRHEVALGDWRSSFTIIDHGTSCS
jgi:hypothetical protein